MDLTACRKILIDANRNQGEHAGLILSRYLLYQDNPEEKAKLFLDAISACQKSTQKIYASAFSRRFKLFSNVTNCMFYVKGRLIVGLGSDNVLETGITLHHTYGTPVIPGSALKGLASHYCDQVWAEKDKNFKAELKAEDTGKITQGEYHRVLFGTEDFIEEDKKHAGYIIFHDAWIDPHSFPKVEITSENLHKLQGGLIPDIMTPHHSGYYSRKNDDKTKAPFDTHEPVPINFLSVTGGFHFAVTCMIKEKTARKAWERLAMDLLCEALKYWGVGGKTSAGYGRLSENQYVYPDLTAAFYTREEHKSKAKAYGSPMKKKRTRQEQLKAEAEARKRIKKIKF